MNEEQLLEVIATLESYIDKGHKLKPSEIYTALIFYHNILLDMKEEM